MTDLSTLHNLSNPALLEEAIRLAAHERRGTAQLIAAIAEIDARRLYLDEGYPSMYAYCTGMLRLSTHAAYDRIAAARVARRFAVVLDHLAAGSLTLTSVTLLAPHLTAENYQVLFQAAKHRSRQEVEGLIAALRPLPAVPSTVERSNDSPGLPSPAVQPLAPGLFKIQFTVTQEVHDRLRQVQHLLQHSIPDGDVGKIFEKALTLLLKEVERKKFAATDHPREPRPAAEGSRHIPAAVKRAVRERDGGRCAFVGTQGRCESRGCLEFHHKEPYAAGGAAVAENIELRCRAHNQREAELFYRRRPYTAKDPGTDSGSDGPHAPG